MLQPLPTHLQQQPLLRIHRPGLAPRNPEKLRIKPGHISQKRTTTRIGLTHRIRIRIKQPPQIPTPIPPKTPPPITPPTHQNPRPPGNPPPASAPPTTKSHNPAAESTPPGNRHAIPTTAIGSNERARRSRFCCFSNSICVIAFT